VSFGVTELSMTMVDPFDKENYKNHFTPLDASKVLCELELYTSIALHEMQLDKQIGYTFKPVACACYALRSVSSGATFNDTLCEIISEGGDADTNCCVVGAVLGSVFDEFHHPLVKKLKFLPQLTIHIDSFTKAKF
jgi:ADP-ribosylglycohydrolase